VRRRPDQGGDAMSVYLYALIGSAGPARLGSGMTGEPLRTVACGDVVAVVGDMPEPPAIDQAALHAHDQTVRRIAAAAEAVLPARFGSLVGDEVELARRLEPLGPSLAAALARVAGTEQMTLRVYEREGAASTTVSVPSDLGPGARHLVARAQRRGHVAWNAVRAAVLPALEPLVREARVESHDTPPLVATVHHLIERGRGELYAATAHRAAAGLAGASVEVRGPWPPYAFAAEPVS
jgi:hypothetical protein